MAEVDKVWDRMRATHLAMKLLHAELAQDVIFLRRFTREARMLQKLNHPNIVRFFGLDQDDLLAFILMEYIDGISLKTEIFRARSVGMPLHLVKKIIDPISSALHYAHNNGYIHCDIKPTNILIEKTGRVVLTDFGIARMSDAATATMVGIGSPAYMAPEQIRGKDPTPQTDIYALGIVLFEMLTGGERPFTGEHAEITGTSSEKVRWEQLHLDAPSLHEINSNIPNELDAIVQKCLKKNPTQRYPNISAFNQSFESGLSSEAVQEYAQSVTSAGVLGQIDRSTEAAIDIELQEEPTPEPKRNWLLLIGIPIGLLILLCAIIGGYYAVNNFNNPTSEFDRGQIALALTQTALAELTNPSNTPIVETVIEVIPGGPEIPTEPSVNTPDIPLTDTPYIPPSDTPNIPPTDTPYIPPTNTPYILPTDTPNIPTTDTPYIPPSGPDVPGNCWWKNDIIGYWIYTDVEKHQYLRYKQDGNAEWGRAKYADNGELEPEILSRGTWSCLANDVLLTSLDSTDPYYNQLVFTDNGNTLTFYDETGTMKKTVWYRYQ